MAINYVRFQRGTLAAYQALLEKGSIDENTLYFIYDENDSTGSLYMGEKIISGGDTNYIFSTLDELSDVNVADAESNSFLVKDNATDNWVAKTPAQVAELIQEYINNEPIINLESDNLSVEILDNVIQLKNYGTQYYAYVPAVKDETGNIEVYASIYDPNDPQSKLEAIETEKEWKVIETILESIQEESKKSGE